MCLWARAATAAARRHAPAAHVLCHPAVYLHRCALPARRADTPGRPCWAAGPAAGSQGIWSVRWSRSGAQVIAGTSSHALWVYDMAAGHSTSSVRAHRDDVNAVEYLDAGCAVVLTGSDDNLIKARRVD